MTHTRELCASSLFFVSFDLFDADAKAPLQRIFDGIHITVRTRTHGPNKVHELGVAPGARASHLRSSVREPIWILTALLILWSLTQSPIDLRWG